MPRGQEIAEADHVNLQARSARLARMVSYGMSFSRVSALAHDRLAYQAGLWRAFAVRDGSLVTGQQNFSGAQTARLVCEALGR